MKNNELADLLYEIADFLEIKEEQYKPRAYRTAVRNVESLSEDIEDIEDVHERGEFQQGRITQALVLDSLRLVNFSGTKR